MKKKFEYNLWTELLAFENTDPDRGAARYLESIPEKPDTIFLFICAADFVFGHHSMDSEYILSPAVCSRNAHAGNEQRNRQKWTNFQLRELIGNLKRCGVSVYLSMFTCAYHDKYGPEWLTQHKELLNHISDMSAWRLNPINCLTDGTPCEDIFAPKLAVVCRDYGFSGFHGADRFNSTGLLHRRIASDNITAQFLRSTGLKAPGYVTRECDENPDRQKKRMSWIWGEHRVEFTEFIRARWKRFWKTVADSIHGTGGKCLMNSSFTRGSHAAAAFLGIDYKEIAEAGVDAIVCETVPLSMSNQAAPSSWKTFEDIHRHYHNWCIVAMMEIRAYLPDTKIYFLHGCRDVVEYWDNIRQAPAGYERELFALASCCHYGAEGLKIAADGLTACLADGFSASDWTFITKCWKAAIKTGELLSAGEMVFVWDDRMVTDGVEDYFLDHFPSAFDTIYDLKYRGLAIQSTVRSDNLHQVREPLCVPSAHLLGEEMVTELAKRTEPVVLIGRSAFLKQFAEKGEFFTDSNFSVLVLNGANAPFEKTYLPESGRPAINEGGRNFLEINAFTAVMPQMGISKALKDDAFTAICAALDSWRRCTGQVFAECPDAEGECTLLSRTFSDGTIETILENLVIRNIAKTIRFSKKIIDCKITSSFPIHPDSVVDGDVRIHAAANRGMCAIAVRTESSDVK